MRNFGQREIDECFLSITAPAQTNYSPHRAFSTLQRKFDEIRSRQNQPPKKKAETGKKGKEEARKEESGDE